MRRTLLISVAALALAAGGQVFAQGTGSGGTSGAGGGTGGSGSGTMQQNPSGSAGSSGMSGGSTGQSSGATRESPSTGSAQTETAPGGGQKGTKQGQTEQRGGSKQGASERNGGSKQGASESTTKQGGTSTGTTAGRSGGGSTNVTLNTEQKTKIRQSVLTSSAPRVSTVNFDVRVGTVVPRSVHLVTLPPILVDIAPEWRGYRYFVYHDEIVIVEPDTLRIVAVLEV